MAAAKTQGDVHCVLQRRRLSVSCSPHTLGKVGVVVGTWSLMVSENGEEEGGGNPTFRPQ